MKKKPKKIKLVPVTEPDGEKIVEVFGNRVTETVIKRGQAVSFYAYNK